MTRGVLTGAPDRCVRVKEATMDRYRSSLIVGVALLPAPAAYARPSLPHIKVALVTAPD